MKWLPRKGKKVDLSKEPVTVEEAETKQQLRDVRSNWAEVNRLVGRLATMNEENHFSQIIIEAMQGGGK